MSHSQFYRIKLNRCVTFLWILINLLPDVKCIAPTISHISSSKKVNVGDTVDLECAVQYGQNYPVIWAKINPNDPLGTVFLSKDASLTTPDNRYSIRHDPSSYTWTIQLSKIREMDAGIYQCQVITSASNKVTADVHLTVEVSPSILDNSTRTIETIEGMKIELQCYAIGNPLPQITWRRQNNDILPAGSSVYKGNVLVIYNVTKEDRGTYYCVANNGVGKEAKRNVKVYVEFAPQVMPEQPEYAQAIGYPVDLVCNVEGFPSAEVMWLKDNYRLTGERYYVTHSDVNEIVTTTLRIIKITPGDFGEYVCHATNKLAKDQKTIKLVQSSEPVCPPACLSLTQGASQLLPFISLIFLPYFFNSLIFNI